jgi:papain like cysteine protease AvrRpt2
MNTKISHRVVLFPQPTNMSCWSAAVTMLFGDRSVGPGRGTLGPTGGLQAQSVPAFAQSYGLQVHYPQSWTVQGLVNLLRRGPVAMLGNMPDKHAVVIGGISSDGTPGGTELTIYDPWPPGIGKVGRINYKKLTQTFPTATTYMLQR